MGLYCIIQPHFFLISDKVQNFCFMFFRAFQSAAKNGQFAKMYYNNTLQVEQTFNADETVSKIVDNVTDNV